MTRFVIYKMYWPGKAFYIGKTRGFAKRKYRHKTDIIEMTHHNKNVLRCGLLWGLPKFKVLMYCDSDEHLAMEEKRFLEYYKNHKNCKNIQKNLT